MVAVVGCSKQNEPEPLVYPELLPKVKSEAYYEALRNYKKSDHAIAFGWWGLSGVSEFGSDMKDRYEGLPDSMDIVSLWGGLPKLGSKGYEEMQSVRKRKGTKFVICIFGSGVEKLMRENFPELSKTDVLAAIDAVAKSLSDTINKYDIDGFDLDYEPAYGDNSIFGDSGGSYATNDRETQRLFKALSQYMGPMSGTDKLLIIDGQFDIGIEPYVNYLVQQAYGSTSAASLQSRFNNFGAGVLPSKKFVPTENMQQYGPKGTTFNINGVNIGSVLGMAQWNPTQGRKGGFGGYIIEQDAKSNPAQGMYYHIRRGIQIQNPAIK